MSMLAHYSYTDYQTKKLGKIIFHDKCIILAIFTREKKIVCGLPVGTCRCNANIDVCYLYDFKRPVDGDIKITFCSLTD